MERKRDLGVFTVSESMVSGKRYPTVGGEREREG